MIDDSHAETAFSVDTAVGPIEQVVLQPTPFCNLDCTYCYLPDRLNRKTMSIETAARAFRVLSDSDLLARRVECRWHAGEPLVVGTAFYREAIRAIRDQVGADAETWHSVQTNGTLIDDDWLEFFAESGMQVGLSLDGPTHLHDRHRLTRQGRGTHEVVMRAAAQLAAQGIEFDVIAVVTSETLADPDGFYDFFADLGVRTLGFNIEETEGPNVSRSLADSSFLRDYRTFMERIFERQRDGRVRIREFEEARDAILAGSHERKGLMVHPFSIVSVGCGGEVSTFSPELLGLQHPEYDDFVIGNVWRDTVGDMLESPLFRRIDTDVRAGIDACRETCRYFFLCGGGAPSNKLYENGCFRSTETAYCIARVQVAIDIVVEDLTARKRT